MSVEIEREWTTGVGLRAIALILKYGDRKVHRCGYVEIPKGHFLHSKKYGEEVPELSNFAALAGGEIGQRGTIPVMIAAMKAASRTDDTGGECADIVFTPDVFFDVHGSITYTGENPSPAAFVGEWWFGFDCGHYDDAPIEEPGDLNLPGELGERFGKLNAMLDDIATDRDLRSREIRSLDFVVDQCENLAQQIWMVT